MPATDPMQNELEDLEQKLSSARDAAAAPGATEKDKADLKLIEQAYLAAEQKARRAPGGGSDHQPTDPKKKLDKKLDDALKGTFPGSDPISFVEAAPVKEEDHSLPDIKVAEQQAPGKTKAARKSK